MLDGIPIRVCPCLPRTVKDRDGNDVELLGIMVSPDPDTDTPWGLDGVLSPPRIVLLTGAVIRPAPPKEPPP